MHSGSSVFSQLMEFLPWHEFHACVRRYRGDWRLRGFSCCDQFLCQAFAQLTFRESLRDIETCLRALGPKLYHAGLRSDQTIVLAGPKPSRLYSDPLRRVAYRDEQTERRFVFLTNNFTLPALSIAQLYQCRWQVELFFKWIKQHLRIKAFYGTTDNAVKTQVWIAISVYVLVAIVKKELQTDRSRHWINWGAFRASLAGASAIST